MIYLDNAATTNYKPQEVIDAVNFALLHSFNANRSAHGGSIAATQSITKVREKAARFTNCAREECTVFTKNCTEALNIAVLGSARRKGHVIADVTQHNSVLRPLMELQKRGIIEVTFLHPDEEGIITPKSVLEAVRQNTYMVITCAVSNVTGKSQPIKEIGNALYNKRITYLVDCAQAAGYIPLDMQSFNIDMLAYPAHKGLHGMQGLGVLSFNERTMPNPINYGGTGSDSQNIYQPNFTPDCFESGTQNCPAIYALGAAIDWWTLNYRVNLPKISELCLLLHNELRNIKNLTLLSAPNSSGIVSFDIAGRDSNEIGDILSQKGIAVRSGLHCAPLMHKYLGSFERGLTRVSLSAENTVDDCYFLISALDKIVKGAQ